MPNLKLTKNQQKKLLYSLYVIVVAVFGFFHTKSSLTPLYNEGNSSVSSTTNQDSRIYKIGNFVVSRVVDGDTVHVKDENGREEIVRFMSVNTLEMTSEIPRELCLAKQEKDFTIQNLQNQDVELWGDKTQPERDKYNRLLAYVKVASSTDFFNDVLMKTGNAKVYKANPPAANYKKYLDLQTNAQSQNLGMWNLQTCN